jgi:hypothetical protein
MTIFLAAAMKQKSLQIQPRLGVENSTPNKKNDLASPTILAPE